MAMDNAKTISVLVVEPGKPPYMGLVKNTVKDFERFLGGEVEVGGFPRQNVMLAYRGDGMRNDLTPNRVIASNGQFLSGPFLLCGAGAGGDEGDFASLTPGQREEFQRYFAVPGEYMKIGRSIICVSPKEFAETALTLWQSMQNGETVMISKWGGPGRDRSV